MQDASSPIALLLETYCRNREGKHTCLELLDHGAEPNVRASLRKRLWGVEDETEHEYHDITPLGWGERFHDQSFVSRPPMLTIAKRGGIS